MSGQLLWSKEGAPCNLLASPAKTNVCWAPLVAPYPVAPEGRSSGHGTATSLPAPAEEVLDKPEFLDEASVVALVPLVLEVPVVLPVVVFPVVLLLPLVEEVQEITAKSILPEPGLTMISLIVPNSSPVEPFTFAPISLLARISFWLVRPVAEKCPVESEEDSLAVVS